MTERAIAEQIITGIYSKLDGSKPHFVWLDGPVSSLWAWRLVRSFDWLGRQSAAQFLPLAVPRGLGMSESLLRSLDHSLAEGLEGVFLTGEKPPNFRAWFWGSFWSQLEQTGLPHVDHLRYVLQKYFDGDPYRLVRVPDEAAALAGGLWGGTFEPPPSELDQPRSAEALGELQAVCGWWLPCRHMVFCSELPRHIHVDMEGRLHGERGPALRLSGVHSIYAWRGTRVPADWIEDRSCLSPSIAFAWHNAEQRRAAIEMLGWTKVLAGLSMRTIHADPNPEIGTLIECDLPHAPASRFLRVRCGTGREFVLSVPREMTTARQANAWTYGLTSDEYQPEARA